MCNEIKPWRHEVVHLAQPRGELFRLVIEVPLYLTCYELSAKAFKTKIFFPIFCPLGEIFQLHHYPHASPRRESDSVTQQAEIARSFWCL